ncbi:TPA: restriction endonuclease subunit S [Streptococcus suis]
MSKLEECILSDLVEFQRGYDLPKSKFVEGKYPVQSSNGILGYHNEYKVEGPGITIGRSGTVGTPHLIRENFFPHNTSLFVKEFKGNDIEYIYYLLQYLDLGNQKSGSGVPTMNRNHLHPIKIRAYRDKTYQQRTIKILSLIDKKIQINNQINQELEAMAKTLYDYWFVQFDFPDQNGKPYKSSGGKMVYNPELKREIPEGWGVEKLENIANITMGQSPKGTSYNEVGEGMLFFQGSTDFGWRFPVARQYTTEPSRIAEEDDILLSVRAPVGTLNIADTRCCIGRGLAAINSKVGANSYIFNVMQDFKKLFDMMNSVGTTFGSITKDDLYSLKLIYPPNELLMKFDKSVNSFDREIKNRSRQNQELSQLRDWLLPMLMNGQVKVEDKT